MNTKRLFAILLSLAIILTLTACGGGDDSDYDDYGGSSPDQSSPSGGSDVPPNGSDGEDFNPSAWYGTYKSDAGVVLTITSHELANNFNFEITDADGSGGMSGYLEMMSEFGAWDDTFEIMFALMGTNKRVEINPLTDYGTEYAGYYFSEDDYDWGGGDDNTDFDINFADYDEGNLITVFAAQNYYMNGDPDADAVYLGYEGFIYYLNNQPVSGDYSFDGDRIALSINGEEMGFFEIIDAATLMDDSGNIFTLYGADDHSIWLDNRYYLNGQEDSLIVRFYDDIVEFHIPEGGVLEYAWTDNGINGELNDYDVRFFVVNSYILECGGYYFIRRP